ncbi:hypothetical protein [Methylobacillus glycogenes]|uniref:hypothetical protein n=1 Tax=Methylobacillus glycogenes TaxID=406 RepID=UPI0004711379|nr:hypothetical protein [Methylobacillus glycogenes]
MFKPGDIVLIDTNVIIEAHRAVCWKPLSHHFQLHTVSKVIEETQTGFQNRNPEQLIEINELKSSFAHIESIETSRVIAFDLEVGEVGLDDGEKALIIYAQSLKQPVWYLNSPDLAAVRYMSQQGWQDRLVSLESMLKHLKHRSKNPLKNNYTEAWLSQARLKNLL